MEKKSNIKGSTLLERIWGFFRKCLFLVLSFGPMPNHIAFIMDGNRRFAKNRGIKQGSGHRVGFAALISTLQYCYEMGVKYVTVYAFSIDNFKRKPDEVHSVMTLMQEKIDELLMEESIVNQYGIRINFWGNLNLLNEPVRLAAEKAMASTAKNTESSVRFACANSLAAPNKSTNFPCIPVLPSTINPSSHLAPSPISSSRGLRPLRAQDPDSDKRNQSTKTNSIVCPKCEGNGAMLCTQCEGSGVNSKDHFNGQFKAGGLCWLCRGKREILCGNCNGAGFLGGFMSTFDE